MQFRTLCQDRHTKESAVKRLYIGYNRMTQVRFELRPYRYFRTSLKRRF